MRPQLLLAIPVALCLVLASLSHAEDAKPGEPSPADPLAKDLELLQGKWEMLHGNEGKGPPTIQSVKEIKGNRETLRRYDIATGTLTREHTVEFKLSSSGNVRVFTFYGVGGDPQQGLSFVYKVDGDYFYDIPGLLQGDGYRNYQESPRVWRWKRVKEDK